LKNIFKDSFYAILNKGCYFGLRLLILFFFSKSSSSNVFSAFIYIINLSEIFRLLIDFGIDTVYIRIIATDNENHDKILNDVFSLKVFLTGIGYFLLILLSFLLIHDFNLTLVVLMGLLLPITANSLFITSFFQAKGKNKLLAPYFFVATVINLILAFLFKSVNQCYYVFYLFSEFSFLVAGIIALAKFFPFKIQLKFSLEAFKKVYSNSRFVGVTQTIGTAYSKTDLMFIEKLAQSGYVAQYGFFNKFIEPFLMISSITSTAAYSFFSKKIDLVNPQGLYKSIKQFFLFALLYGLVVGSVITFVLPFFLTLIKSQYILTPIIALCFGILTLLRILNGVLVSIYYTLCEYKFILVLFFFCTLLLIGSYFLFIPRLQIQGVLLALILSEFVSLIVKGIKIQRHFAKQI
jgi:O-antigen/teichoic acid export membrane protein